MSDPASRVRPYVEQLFYNDDVRENIQRALSASREVAGRTSAKRRKAQAIQDRRVQQRAQEAAQAVRDVVLALSQAPQKQRRQRRGRVIIALVLGGGVVALGLNPAARERALGLVGGGGASAGGPAPGDEGSAS